MIAIDPGASGGMALNRPYDGQVRAFRMPDTDRGVFLSIYSEDKVAYLEDLVKYTGRNMPSSSMATYASNWGFIKGVLTASQYRVVLVKPKDWQKALGLGSVKGMTKTEWKNKLKNKAEQLFPDINVTLATADALLILEAARRGLIG